MALRRVSVACPLQIKEESVHSKSIEILTVFPGVVRLSGESLFLFC